MSQQLTATFLGGCIAEGTGGIGAGGATGIALLGTRHHTCDAAHYDVEAQGKNEGDNEMLHGVWILAVNNYVVNFGC